MPTVVLDKEAVLKCLGKKIDDRTLLDRIPMLGTDLEKIDDKEITVEIFPNRPDMLSEEGFGRSLAGFLGLKTGMPKYEAKKSEYRCIVDKSTKIRPYIGLAIIKNIKMSDAYIRDMIQLQEKLNLTMCRKRKKADIGVFDLDKISFPIKYTTVPRDFKFKPLLSEKEMSVSEILEKTSQGREYEYIVSKFEKVPAFIDAKGELMCVIPIIQAEYSKVTEKTKNIFIDVIGLDERTVRHVLNILTCNLIERGGELYSVTIEKPGSKKIITPDLSTANIKLKLDYVNKRLGLNLSEKEVISLLKKMRYDAALGINVKVPCYRADVLHPIDLVEDIAIAYGYENFKPEIPKVVTIGEEKKITIFERKLAEICAGLGLLECNTYNLSNKKILLENMLLLDKKMVQTINAVNIDYDTVRDSIVPILLNVLSENKHHEYPQNLFEIGAINRIENGKIVESLNIGIVLCFEGAGFVEIRSHVESIFRALGMEISLAEAEHRSYIPGRVASVFLKGKKIGMLGEISPQVLNNFGLEQPVAAAEICVNPLI